METKLEDSNLAGIGSDMDASLRQSAAASEEQFNGAGSSVGMEIWRIEKFEPVRIDQTEFGLFYSGDSYICLNTFTEDGSDELKFDLHFWLGKDSTQDEKGAAAYFTVNIDDLLGGKPVQFRETQSAESEKFAAYFPMMQFVDGGVDSGFTKVVPETYVPKLLHVKGKDPVRVNQVPMSCASLNSGDVFILDTGAVLYQWNTPGSGPFERSRASQVCAKIEEFRQGDAHNEVIDGDEVHDHATWWEFLGEKGDIAEPTSDEPLVDDDPVKKLFKATDEEGKMTVSLIEEGEAISASNVEDDDIMVVVANGKAYLREGLTCSAAEKFYLTFQTDWVLEQCGLAPTAQTTILKVGQSSAEWDALF